MLSHAMKSMPIAISRQKFSFVKKNILYLSSRHNFSSYTGDTNITVSYIERRILIHITLPVLSQFEKHNVFLPVSCLYISIQEVKP